MTRLLNPKAAPERSLETLDRIVIVYLTLPLAIFVLGWLQAWIAVPLLASIAYALRHLLDTTTATAATAPSITRLQLGVAIVVGIGWTALGGTGHLVFANSDWHIRDAVLHDLVASPWPVGYGVVDGMQIILRAPLGYYLPAALIGKLAGLQTGHFAMAAWTATGVTLFLLQVFSLMPSRKGVLVMASLVVVFFSGFDILGSLLNNGSRFRSTWHIATHLEWWAGLYQYSSMTTQLFWVPNHALGGWLTVGLLSRHPRSSTLDYTLPMVVVAVALWSPLAAIGLVPFVACRVIASSMCEHSLGLLHPQVWAPALIVGVVVAAYLGLDTGGLPLTWSLDWGGKGLGLALLQQAQFFLLEAGLIGYAILAIQRSSQVILALVMLALLPLVNFGPGNDFVMRASIPSLAILAIGACLALSAQTQDWRERRKKLVLGCMLLIGAVTAVQEMARTVVLPAWPINLQATLIGAACGQYPAHYVAHLGEQGVRYLLREPQQLELGPQGRQSCGNPAIVLMWRGGLLQ